MSIKDALTRLGKHRDQLPTEENQASARMAEAQAKKARERHARWEEMVSPEYRVLDPDRMPQDLDWNAADVITGWRYGPKGMFIIGGTGRGKTRLICQLATRLVIDEGRDVLMVGGMDFSLTASEGMLKTIDARNIIRKYSRCEVLIIDDLAKRMTAATAQVLYEVLELRTSHRRPFICTTNTTGDQLSAAIGDQSLAMPIRRRIKEFCQVVVI